MDDDFIDWFIDKIYELIEVLKNAIVIGFSTMIGLLLLPIWILPFIYWYFFKRKKEE